MHVKITGGTLIDQLYETLRKRQQSQIWSIYEAKGKMAMTNALLQIWYFLKKKLK